MINKMSTSTIVTAFFNFSKKKFNTGTYYYWMTNYLPNINNPMIIFTDNITLPIIQKLCIGKEHMTDIIIIDNINKFHTYKYIDYWNKDVQRDHERNYHSTELYMIWNEKSYFLKLAIDKNTFNTDYFIWTDIGMIREDYYKPLISKFPNNKTIKSLNPDKVYLLNLQNKIEKDNNYPTEKFRYINCIGGGVIFGHKIALNKWIEEYYNMLKLFIKNDYFAGKDQSIMANVYIKNPDLIELVEPQTSPYNNEWFYMLHYLS
jgi:hypothetical protein